MKSLFIGVPLTMRIWPKCQNWLAAWLHGCMADGATYQEALTNAQIVIDDWIETALLTQRFIPEPKGRLAYA